MTSQVHVFYHDHLPVPLPEGHRFPMPKYELLRKRVFSSEISSLIKLQPGPAATNAELRRAHDTHYVHRVLHGELTAPEIRQIGFPWSEELVERTLRSVGSTIAACRAAVDWGLGINLAGGTHHAGKAFGQGFCVFNDVAVAARAMQAEGRANRIVILDCDVHQGNGTAGIFAFDPSVFTFSIHAAKNFPFRKTASSLDVALEDDADDAIYLEALKIGVERALTSAGAELAIYLAGADPYVGDRLGRLAVSMRGLAERDRVVLSSCKELGLPVAIAMAGGYGRQIEDTVDIHFQTVRAAVELSTIG